jgi:hypothetical protein
VFGRGAGRILRSASRATACRDARRVELAEIVEALISRDDHPAHG